MVCGGCRVKFAAGAVCPICYGAVDGSGPECVGQLQALKRPSVTGCDVTAHPGGQAEAATYKSQIRGMMNAFSEHREELERYEQMFGLERGRLAVSLDRLTNALVLGGQHSVYFPSNRNPMVPTMDLRIISLELTHAKELLQSVMEELRKKKEADGVK